MTDNLERIKQLGEELEFELLFAQIPDRYLVLDPDFSIVAVSNAYLEATLTERDKLIGKNIFEAFPDDPNDPEATGVANLSASLQTVIETSESHTMAPQRYPIQRPDGTWEERWWQPKNSPVFGNDGKLMYVIHRVDDVTELIRASVAQ